MYCSNRQIFLFLCLIHTLFICTVCDLWAVTPYVMNVSKSDKRSKLGHYLLVSRHSCGLGVQLAVCALFVEVNILQDGCKKHFRYEKDCVPNCLHHLPVVTSSHRLSSLVREHKNNYISYYFEKFKPWAQHWPARKLLFGELNELWKCRKTI